MDIKIATNLLISRKDMEERKAKTQQRIHDVGISCGFIKGKLFSVLHMIRFNPCVSAEAFEEYQQLEAEKSEEDRWNSYVRCDGLPRPYLPPEVRTFIAEKQHYQQFSYDQSVDWTLSVDNRTILTQNIFRVDRTREKMKEQLNDHIGDRFQKDIYMFLQTLVNIECMLDNPSEMLLIDNNVLMEIMQVHNGCSRTDINLMFAPSLL